MSMSFSIYEAPVFILSIGGIMYLIHTAQLAATSFRDGVPRSGYYILFLYPGGTRGYNRSKPLYYNTNNI